MAAIEKVKFQNGLPVVLALKYARGKAVESQFTDGMEMMFSSDRGAFFVPEEEGKVIQYQIAKQGIQAGEQIQITRDVAHFGQGRKSVEWKIEKLAPAAGEQRDGTFRIPASSIGESDLERDLRRSIEQADAKRAAALTAAPNANTNTTYGTNGSSNGHAPAAPPAQHAHQGWALYLLERTNALTDVYAAALDYAAKHKGAVKAEDVKSFLVTSFINQSKSGGSYGS